jgi:aminopeptidase N
VLCFFFVLSHNHSLSLLLLLQIRVNLKATTVTFLFAQDLPVSSKITLTIEFQGFLNNQMAGFYRSTYKDFQGKEKIVASTQFEALDARRAFPCVDEPAVKATFVVRLTVPSYLETFSNMPEASRVTHDSTDLVTICFLESPKMSTYLLAYCVGEFDFLQAQTSHGVLIKVYAPKGRSASGQYALECACKCLDEYNDFFGIPYVRDGCVAAAAAAAFGIEFVCTHATPFSVSLFVRFGPQPLPKLDMVAIPEFVSCHCVCVGQEPATLFYIVILTYVVLVSFLLICLGHGCYGELGAGHVPRCRFVD